MMDQGGITGDKVATGDPGAPETIFDLCGDVVTNAKILVRAEIGRLRALAFRRLVKSRLAVLFMVSSALLTQSAVMVMLVGLMMFLHHYVGILLATLISMVIALVAAGILGWLAFRQIKRAVGEADKLT
jgi:hypothetical protein